MKYRLCSRRPIIGILASTTIPITNSTKTKSKTSTAFRNDLIILAIIILFVAPTTILLIRRRFAKKTPAKK